MNLQKLDSITRLDFERLRIAQSQFDRPQAEAGSDALPAFLGRVVSSGTSLKVGQFCKVVPTTALGVEQEGSTGVFADSVAGGSSSATPTTVLVYLLGSHLPSTGDYLVCQFVDHRWVAATTSAQAPTVPVGVTLPSCFCLVPTSLQMVSNNPKCNYGMFQSCSIQYGPPPPAMAKLGFETNVFSSSQMFYDQISFSNFFYYFSCQNNQFFLSRVYPTSPYGSPYLDGILYSWAIGGYGNSCNPFSLLVGTPYPGSDKTCSVGITG